jgi:hypothetical protein
MAVKLTVEGQTIKWNSKKQTTYIVEDNKLLFKLGM